VSVGGALGGAFAANIAPLLLTPHIEYMLLIVHAGVARPGGGNRCIARPQLRSPRSRQSCSRSAHAH